jgi:ketosteroid isomerase-like protein
MEFTLSSNIAALLHAWADRTANGMLETILKDHAPDAVIFDVLRPLRHDGTAAYRATWDDWQPRTEGTFTFRLEDLTVTEGSDIAFAHGLLRCGGTNDNGGAFQDLVRATFCVVRHPEGWRITHQHISAPR